MRPTVDVHGLQGSRQESTRDVLIARWGLHSLDSRRWSAPGSHLMPPPTFCEGHMELKSWPKMGILECKTGLGVAQEDKKMNGNLNDKPALALQRDDLSQREFENWILYVELWRKGLTLFQSLPGAPGVALGGPLWRTQRGSL